MVKVACATLPHTHSELAGTIVEQLINKLTLNTVSSNLGTKTGGLARVVHYDTCNLNIIGNTLKSNITPDVAPKALAYQR